MWRAYALFKLLFSLLEKGGDNSCFASYLSAIVRISRDDTYENTLYHVSCKELLESGNVICSARRMVLALGVYFPAA